MGIVVGTLTCHLH